MRSAESRGDERLRLRFGELAPATQAALLQLDPVADREEYAELRALLAEARPESLSELATADRPEARRLGLRLGNLGLEELGVWARADAGSLLDALDDPAVRCLVVDTGSLPTREEQALVAESVLRGVWERRRERRPLLLVIDEAHNVCPAASADVLTALATEHAIRIAGEGRKFGIYMLVATQRPQKVHENVISQCDNLVLMRLNSSADAAFIAAMFGFAPPGLVGLATDFRLGEALVAGKLASHPAVLRFGARVAREGGGDVERGLGGSAGLGDRHGRPGGEDADGHARRVDRGEALELARRQARIVAPPHARARERAPVDRHRHPRRQQPRRLRGALRVEVPRAHAGPPAPHGQQRDVDALRQPAHAVEEVRVAGEVDARAALDDEAHRAEVLAPRRPAPVVDGLRHHHVQALHAHAVAGRDGDRLVPGPPPDERRDTVRRDHRGAGRQVAQRRQVEMVVMGVREEHGVDARLEVGDRDEPADVPDPLAQHGIRQHPGAVELDQGRGVTHVGEETGGQTAEPFMRRWMHHGASTGAPHCPRPA